MGIKTSRELRHLHINGRIWYYVIVSSRDNWIYLPWNKSIRVPIGSTSLEPSAIKEWIIANMDRLETIRETQVFVD